MVKLLKVGLGGGCHWCTEGVFVSLRGVRKVEQGWITSVVPDDAPSEAVIVHYDPSVTVVAELIAVHLQTHAATAAHALRSKYRSAIYAFTEDDMERYCSVVDELAADYAAPLQTRVLPFVEFLPSLPEHQDYYRSDPERPFCRRYIAPKLERLRRDRPDLFFPNKQ